MANLKANSKKDAVEKLREDLRKARKTAGAALRDKPVDELGELVATHKMGDNINGWKNPYPTTDPRNLLLEYQFAWREDASRFKCALMSRQTGKDFSSESEAAEDCHARPRTEWMIAAPSERQALDSLEQGKTWAEGFDLKIADYEENREGGSETLLKSAEIIFANGSRMRAVPGKPNTVRGRSANLLLTEFDFFEDPPATWRAVLPSITNPLRGGEKKVRLITTPNGSGSAMHKIWTKDDGDKMKWSRHFVTLYHAVLMGLPVDVEQIRQAFDDPDGFAQEFLCQFLDGSNVLLPYDVIQMAESAEATEFWNFQEAGTLAEATIRPSAGPCSGWVMCSGPGRCWCSKTSVHPIRRRSLRTGSGLHTGPRSIIPALASAWVITWSTPSAAGCRNGTRKNTSSASSSCSSSQRNRSANSFRTSARRSRMPGASASCGSRSRPPSGRICMRCTRSSPMGNTITGPAGPGKATRTGARRWPWRSMRRTEVGGRWLIPGSRASIPSSTPEISVSGSLRRGCHYDFPHPSEPPERPKTIFGVSW